MSADLSAPPPAGSGRYLLGSWVSCGRAAGWPSGPLRSSAQGSPGARAETGRPRCRGTCDGTGVRAAFLAPRGSGLGLHPAHFLPPCCQRRRRRSPACGRSPALRSLCSCAGISAPPPAGAREGGVSSLPHFGRSEGGAVKAAAAPSGSTHEPKAHASALGHHVAPGVAVTEATGSVEISGPREAERESKDSYWTNLQREGGAEQRSSRDHHIRSAARFVMQTNPSFSAHSFKPFHSPVSQVHCGKRQAVEKLQNNSCTDEHIRQQHCTFGTGLKRCDTRTFWGLRGQR